MSRFKGIIFDLDGTILDSMGIWERVDHMFLAEQGIIAPPDVSENVKKIEPHAFSNCTSLTTVNVNSEDIVISSTSFMSCTSLTTIMFIGTDVYIETYDYRHIELGRNIGPYQLTWESFMIFDYHPEMSQ